MRFGPETKALPETILAMTTALFYGIVGMGSVFAQDAWRTEIDACWGHCQVNYGWRLSGSRAKVTV